MSCGDSCGCGDSSCGTTLLGYQEPSCCSSPSGCIPVGCSYYPQQTCVDPCITQSCGSPCGSCDLCSSQSYCGTKSTFTPCSCDPCSKRSCCGVKSGCSQPCYDVCGNQSRYVVRSSCLQPCCDPCNKQYYCDSKICDSTKSCSIPCCSQTCVKTCCPSVKSCCKTQSIDYSAKKC